jgi:hypothetical protein
LFHAIMRLLQKTGHRRPILPKGHAGRWRDALTKDQITAIVSQHRSQMERFDHVPEKF